VLLATERLSCRAAHVVVCVSPSLKLSAIADGLAPAQKLEVLGSGSSNGVSIEQFASTPERVTEGKELRSRWRIPDDAFVVGFVGRVTTDKGVVELLEAFQAVREHFLCVHLLIAGDFESNSDLPPRCVDEIRTGNNIHHLGFLADLSGLYAAIDVLVLPTHREGFPNVVLEAAAAGVASITTRATGAVDSVVEGETGLLCDVGDSASLAEAITKLHNDRALVNRLRTRACERAVAEFSNQRVWALWADFLAARLQDTSRKVE
jgi:glycosyltransferase involved in cell wall biosynthesis